MSEASSLKQTRAKALLDETAQAAQPGQFLRLTWKTPGQQLWRTWVGKVLARLNHRELQVLWSGADAPKEVVVFPPAEALRYRSIILEDSPPPLPPTQQVTSPRPDVSWSPAHLTALLESQMDQATGASKMMTTLCAGLRIPFTVSDEDKWMYPQMWTINADEFANVWRAKTVEWSVHFTLASKDDFDVDLGAAKVIISHLGDHPDKMELKPVFMLVFRMLGLIFDNSNMARAPGLRHALVKSFEEGRLDISATFLSLRNEYSVRNEVADLLKKATPPAAAILPVPSPVLSRQSTVREVIPSGEFRSSKNDFRQNRKRRRSRSGSGAR